MDKSNQPNSLAFYNLTEAIEYAEQHDLTELHVKSFKLIDKYYDQSNADEKPCDLATLFTGRTFEIKIYPFSFEEYMKYFNYDNQYLAFNTFMPVSYTHLTLPTS